MNSELIRLLNNLLEKGQFKTSEEWELISIIEKEIIKDSK
jgi:hypothetical protein